MFRRTTVQGDERWFPRPDGVIAYSLLDAMRHPDCPLCVLIQRREDGFLFSLFWENVNSPHIRSRLRESLGFCDLHTRMLRQAVNQPWVGHFGIAILYRDFTQTTLERLRRPVRFPASLFAQNGTRLQRRLSPSRRCWLCEMSEETEDAYLHTLVEGLDSSRSLRDRYSESHGLCVVHAERATHAAKADETRSAVARAALLQARTLSTASASPEDIGRFLLGYRVRMDSTPLAETLEAACPACAAEANAEQIAVWRMTPDDLSSSWRRLCPHHRRRAAMSALRSVRVAEDLVQNIIGRALSDGEESEPNYECPVCYETNQAGQKAALRAGEEMGRRGCLFHVRMALGSGNAAHVKSCVDPLTVRLDALSHDLGELIRKHDYRFSHEPLGEEKDSWLRALAFFGSEKGDDWR